MNWLLWGVVALLVLGVLIGYLQGFIKMAMTLFSAVVSIVLVIFIVPIFTQVITDVTPIDEAIASSFVDLVMADVPMIALESEDGEVIMEYPELSLYEQIDVVESSELPEVMKDLLLTNNNSEIYGFLGVSDFVEYIGAYAAYWMIRVVAFLLTVILVYFLIRTVLYSLDLIAEIPIIHEVNCGLGAMFGGVVALIIVWIAYIVMTLFYKMDWSAMCLDWVDQSKLLGMLYQNNPIMKVLFKL